MADEYIIETFISVTVRKINNEANKENQEHAKLN